MTLVHLLIEDRKVFHRLVKIRFYLKKKTIIITAHILHITVQYKK